LIGIDRGTFVARQIDHAMCGTEGLVVSQWHHELYIQRRIANREIEFDEAVFPQFLEADEAPCDVERAQRRRRRMFWYSCIHFVRCLRLVVCRRFGYSMI